MVPAGEPQALACGRGVARKRVLAALTTACAPVIIGAVHVGNTTPLDLLAWTAVLVCVSTALLRDRPRWWLAAGAAAGVGLEADNLVVLLLIGLAIGLLVSSQRPVLRTRWPWLGAGMAAVIWAPNVIWQATHGWPQLAVSAALHHENTSPADYGTAPAVLAAGAAATERWIARAHVPRARQWLVVGACLVGVAVTLPGLLPILPASDVHTLPASSQQSSVGDSIGWPQLTRAVAAQDAALMQGG